MQLDAAVVRELLFSGTWPRGWEGREGVLYDELDRHGILPLAWEALSRSGGRIGAQLRARLRRRAVVVALGNDRLDGHLRTTLGHLASAKVTPLVIKGAALGQTHYAHSGLRPRCDTDLLVAEADRDTAVRVLLGTGCSRGQGIDGRLATCQTLLLQEDPPGFPHVYDLHWRISNRQAVAARLRHEALLERSVAIPGLGPHARAPCAADALLLACCHRLAHHSDHERLIWLYDIHLLIESLGADAFADFAAAARRKQLVTVCKAGIEAARRTFGTTHPALDAWLREENPPEPWADALLGSWSHLRGLRSDLRALTGWADRARLVREHLFPSASYMRDRYGIRSRRGLVSAYGRRVFRGLAHALRGGPSRLIRLRRH